VLKVTGVLGLVNPTVTGIIGSGVVVHLPSFFKEFDALQAQGQLRYVAHPTKL
jgi:adenylosuccinate synthase